MSEEEIYMRLTLFLVLIFIIVLMAISMIASVVASSRRKISVANLVTIREYVAGADIKPGDLLVLNEDGTVHPLKKV
jgi:hypothetical protein